MPGLDGAGPRGMGPMTGWGMGYCIVPVSTHDEELNYLKKRSEAVVEELRQIEIRISKLEKISRSAIKEVVH